MHPDGGMQFSDTFVDEVKAKLPDTSECILVGCAAGVRSELAIALLAREGGYENLANVEGGMNAWQGMGKPVE
jgi:rhodanese-related sulfurtransferase